MSSLAASAGLELALSARWTSGVPFSCLSLLSCCAFKSSFTTLGLYDSSLLFKEETQGREVISLCKYEVTVGGRSRSCKPHRFTLPVPGQAPDASELLSEKGKWLPSGTRRSRGRR